MGLRQYEEAGDIGSRLMHSQSRMQRDAGSRMMNADRDAREGRRREAGRELARGMSMEEEALTSNPQAMQLYNSGLVTEEGAGLIQLMEYLQQGTNEQMARQNVLM